MKELSQSKPEFKADLKISLTGNVDPSIIKSITNLGLSDQLHQEGFAAHHTAVKHMYDANLLLFVIPVSESNHLIITGKLFEYLATGNPILAIGPTDGNASALLKDAKREPMLDYDNKSEILRQIEISYLNWKKMELSMKLIPPI